jgi:type II secretory pathway component PulF
LNCPRCQAEVPDGPECAACGVVIAKFMVRMEQARTSQPPPAPVQGKLVSTPPSGPPAAQPVGQAPDQTVDQTANQTTGVASAVPVAIPQIPMVAPPASGRRVPARKAIALYSQLGRMLEAGLPVIEALRLAAKNSPARIADGLVAVSNRLEKGETFSEAAMRAPGLFPPGSLVLIQAGEATGGLPTAFAALSSAAELRLDLRRQIIRACIYPFVLFSLVFFVPKAYLLFTVGWLGYLAACLWPYLIALACLVGVVLVLPKALAMALGPERTQRLVRAIPIASGLFSLSARVRFARHLAAGLEAGLGVVAALRLAARSTGDPRFSDKLAQVESSLEQGSSLHQALTVSELFDDEFLLSVATGERIGRLGESLEQQARLLQASLIHRLSVAVQLLSVFILLLTYVFVGRAIIGEYTSIMDGVGDQMDQLLKGLGGTPGSANMDQLLKELGEPAGLSKLPPELRKYMP